MDTFRIEQDCVRLLDQRYLPLRVDWVTCTDAASMADAIATMVVRGAPAIGVAAAFGLALQARVLQRAGLTGKPLLDQMQAAADTLLRSRPTAVNLRWAIEHQMQQLETLVSRVGNPGGGVRVDETAGALSDTFADELARRLWASAQALHDDDIALNRRLGAHGAALLADGARVLTHCNAGALATAGYGTALGVIRAACESGKRISVLADETRPFLQGARLTAWELMQDGIDVTLIADNMAGHLMACGQVDAVIVGTDRVTANGDVVNKIGTYMVAVLAHRHGIPFHVACPLSTLDLRTPTGADVPIEERTADEVVGHAGVRWAPVGVKVRNPAFDVTPVELVTSIITEAGVIHHPARINLTDWLHAAAQTPPAAAYAQAASAAMAVHTQANR